MKLIETLYINCKHNYSSTVNPQNSHVLRFDKKNEHAYGIFYTHISNLYGMIENLQDEGILPAPHPYHVSIIFNQIRKFKPLRSETNLDILKYFINNLFPPVNGVIISIYEHPQQNQSRSHFWLSTIWPFKNKWDNNNKDDYIALQPPENLEDARNYPEIDLIYKRVVERLNQLGEKTVYVGYENTVDQNIKLLTKCRLLVTYTGCSYYLAAGLNVPTISYGPNKWSITDNYEYRKLANGDIYRATLVSHWGSPGHSINKIMHYDDEKGIYHKAQSYTINVGKLETDRDYEIFVETLLRGNINHQQLSYKNARLKENRKKIY